MKNNKKRNNIKYHFLVILIVILICVFGINTVNKVIKKEEDKKKQEEILTDYKNKKIEDIQTEEATKEEINNFVNLVYNDNTTIEEIEKVTATDLVSYNVYYGKDSYFRTMDGGLPNVDDINKIRDTHVEKLEKVIKDNFEVELLDYIVTLDDAVVQRVKYKSFYYTEFMKDYNQVLLEVVSYSDYKDYDFENDINSTKGIADLYKLKVKALEIMCNHLDDYVNEDEYVTYDLVYRKGETAVENDYLSLYMFLGGHLYEHKSLPEDKRDDRVTNMINEAINDGTLIIENPYAF